MNDLAYLNAGAARQELFDGIDGIGNIQVASEVSYARDVDADWGKSFHTGDEQFQGVRSSPGFSSCLLE